jgi:hypothetical protein
MTRRPLVAVAAALAVAAGLLWVGAYRGGGAAQSALAALALAAIAAVAAAGATARRLLGAVVAGAGVVTAVAGTGGGPLPATLGALAAAVLLAAGALLAAVGHRMPQLGTRYRARPRAGARSLWDELDAGRDPTR